MSLIERAKKYESMAKGPYRTFKEYKLEVSSFYVCPNGIAIINKSESVPSLFAKAKIVDNEGGYIVFQLSESDKKELDRRCSST